MSSECPICYEEKTVEMTVARELMSCGHGICVDCYHKWCVEDRNTTCPSCRAEWTETATATGSYKHKLKILRKSLQIECLRQLHESEKRIDGWSLSKLDNKSRNKFKKRRDLTRESLIARINRM